MERVIEWFLGGLVGGLKALDFFAAAAGGFVSLNFFDHLTVSQRRTVAVSGFLLGWLLAQPLTEFFTLKPSVSPGVAILTAVFGMAFLSKFIQEWRDFQLGEFLRRFFDRGGPPSPPPSPPPPPSGPMAPPSSGGGMAPPSSGSGH